MTLQLQPLIQQVLNRGFHTCDFPFQTLILSERYGGEDTEDVDPNLGSNMLLRQNNPYQFLSLSLPNQTLQQLTQLLQVLLQQLPLMF